MLVVYSWAVAVSAPLVAINSALSNVPLLFTSINTFTILAFVVASAVLTFTVMGKVCCDSILAINRVLSVYVFEPAELPT